MKNLTPKERSFIDLYFGEAKLNATEAFRLSEYADSGKHNKIRAYELMSRPHVKAEVKRREGDRVELVERVAEIKAVYLLDKLVEIIEREEEKNPQAALRAIELAGKSIALWKDRQEISGPDGEAIKHEQHVKESATDFTNKLQSLARRATGTDGSGGASNVVKFPDGSGEGGA